MSRYDEIMEQTFGLRMNLFMIGLWVIEALGIAGIAYALWRLF